MAVTLFATLGAICCLATSVGAQKLSDERVVFQVRTVSHGPTSFSSSSTRRRRHRRRASASCTVLYSRSIFFFVSLTPELNTVN